VEIPEFERELAGLKPQLAAVRSHYHQHYVICVRKVLADDALISMSTGDEPRYAVSFVSYVAIDQRDGFFRIAQLLIESLGRLFNGRPHWGKYNQLTRSEAERLYPEFGAFCQIVSANDPEGRFLSSKLQALLNPREDSVAAN
jgi:hypothetical protein